MRAGSVRFVIEGLSLERLINLCIANGVMLEQVMRPGVRAICATVSSNEYPVIRDIAEEQGWKISVRQITGWPNIKMFAWRRAALVTGTLVFLALVWYACNCIWSINIYNAGSYLGEVRTVLAEKDIHIGRFSMWVDVEDLRLSLERRLTGLSWVSVQKDGVRLKVYCVAGTPGANGGNGAAWGDIVATRDGIIESVRVVAGTVQVKQGEAVKAGQVLIKGEERTWQNQMNAVAAKGEVLARVWYIADVIVPRTEIVTVPTGNVAERKIYVSPWYEWSPDAVNPYQQADTHVNTISIGAILPLWLRTEKYEEVAFEEQVRDETQLQAEAGLAALRLAAQEAGLDKQIVDKWTEYSMIDNGMKARATIEMLEDIAKPAE